MGRYEKQTLWIKDHPDDFRDWALPGTSLVPVETFQYCYYQFLARESIALILAILRTLNTEQSGPVCRMVSLLRTVLVLSKGSADTVSVPVCAGRGHL